MDDKYNNLIINIIKAISHPARIKILNILSEGPLCVCDIIPKVGLEQSNLSQHLNLMKNAEILESYKDGLRVIYKIKYPEILDSIKIIENIIEKQIDEKSSILK